MDNIDNNETNLEEYYIIINDEKKIRLLKIAFGDSYINYI